MHFKYHLVQVSLSCDDYSIIYVSAHFFLREMYTHIWFTLLQMTICWLMMLYTYWFCFPCPGCSGGQYYAKRAFNIWACAMPINLVL